MRCGIPYYHYILKYADMSLLNGDHTFPYYMDGPLGKCNPIYQYDTYYMALEEMYFYSPYWYTTHFYCYFRVALRLDNTIPSSANVSLSMTWEGTDCVPEPLISWSDIYAPLDDPCNLKGQSTVGVVGHFFIQPGTCSIVSMTY